MRRFKGVFLLVKLQFRPLGRFQVTGAAISFLGTWAGQTSGHCRKAAVKMKAATVSGARHQDPRHHGLPVRSAGTVIGNPGSSSAHVNC